MRKWLAMVRPNPWLARRLVMLAILVGVGVGAFCWGRHGAVSEVDAQQPAAPRVPNVMAVTGTPGANPSDYHQRVVAYIYDKMPVSREELGEYLIARFGAERIEFLVNRKIVEMACKSAGVAITEADIDRQLNEDIKSFGVQMTKEMFVNQVLKRFNKTLYEWREDVIRPKLALTELVKPHVKVTAEDLQHEFEARFGPKVQCTMIVFKENDPHMKAVWEHARQSEAAFAEEAGKQFIPELAMKKGVIPPIHTHFPDATIEKEAFSMKPGDISSLIQVKQDKTWVLLRCEKHIPADQTARFENLRMTLHREVYDRKLQLKIPEVFQNLRAQANPRILIENGHPTTPQVSTPMPAPPRAN